MKSKFIKFGVALLVVLVAIGGVFFWGSLQAKPAGYEPTDPGEAALISQGWTRFTVDASNRDEWAFFDFESGQSLETTTEANDWDIAFKRTDLLLNDFLASPEIEDWYNYSFITHTVKVKDDTYLLSIDGDLYVSLQFESYYCENEDPACVTFSYRLAS